MKIEPKDIVTQEWPAPPEQGLFVHGRHTGVRIKHLPTGSVVISTQEKTYQANRNAALKRLEEQLLFEQGQNHD